LALHRRNWGFFLFLCSMWEDIYIYIIIHFHLHHLGFRYSEGLNRILEL
jgi:hypothetical protein